MYKKWTEEELILAYLLVRSPLNRIRTVFKSKWARNRSRSCPDYEAVSREFNAARSSLEEPIEQREANCIEHLLHTRRAYVKDISKNIRSYTVKSPIV